MSEEDKEAAFEMSYYAALQGYTAAKMCPHVAVEKALEAAYLSVSALEEALVRNEDT